MVVGDVGDFYTQRKLYIYVPLQGYIGVYRGELQILPTAYMKRQKSTVNTDDFSRVVDHVVRAQVNLATGNYEINQIVDMIKGVGKRYDRY